MKDDKPADESSVFKCLSIITKDEKIKNNILARDKVREKLRQTMDKEQLELFASYEAYTKSVFKNGLDQVTGII